MELIVISDSKLKIALSKSDMERYSLDCVTLDYGSDETRAAFRRILEDVKHQTGFDTASEKMFVQVYASAEGGCEMYITKLKKGSSEEGDTRNTDPFSSVCGAVTLRVQKANRAKTRIYHARCLDDMIGLCAVLCRYSSDCESSVYVCDGEGGGYYIVFSADLRAETDGVPPSSYLEEYGSPCAESTELYIAEHCRCICDGHAALLLGALG